MNSVLSRTLSPNSSRARMRQTSHGLWQEKWRWTLKNHRGNIVAKGERWLISGLGPQPAAHYLASWWVAEGDRLPTAGWTMCARPAWRTKRGVASVPASLIVDRGDRSCGAQDGFVARDGLVGSDAQRSVERGRIGMDREVDRPVGRARVNSTTCPPKI